MKRWGALASGLTACGLMVGIGQPAVADPALWGGAEMWTARFDGTGGHDSAQAVVASADGSRLFVTGGSAGNGTGSDFATVAYSSTGEPLWTARYDGPISGLDQSRALVLSPDGSTLFVSGRSMSESGMDYATVAYSVQTGEQLWVARYDGLETGPNYYYLSNDRDDVAGIAISPDGSKVFVTGRSLGFTPSPDGGYNTDDYATVAYSTATGEQLWVMRYNGSAYNNDQARAIAVHPSGSTVFVTGTVSHPGYMYATVAYDAEDGALLWDATVGGVAEDVAVSPDGSAVYVTGRSDGPGGSDQVTIAYGSSAGDVLWVSRYNGPGDTGDTGYAAVVSPDGSTVLVAGGRLVGDPYGQEFVVSALSASSGEPVWVSRFGNGSPEDLTVSPNGSTVYVTGRGWSRTQDDFSTVALSMTGGTRAWAASYDAAALQDVPLALATSPDGSALYVTGGSNAGRSGSDFLTIAYRATNPCDTEAGPVSSLAHDQVEPLAPPTLAPVVHAAGCLLNEHGL